MSLRKAMIASLAALTLGGATVSADAGPRYGGYHGGGYHGGWRRGWGPGVGLGVLGLGLAAGAIASGAYYNGYGYGYYGGDPCYRYRPTYDAYGNYIGRRLVDVCY